MKSRQIFVACGVFLAMQIGLLSSLLRNRNQPGTQTQVKIQDRALFDKLEVHQGAPKRETPGEVTQMRTNPGESNDIRENKTLD
jgi:hypothetical protein